MKLDINIQAEGTPAEMADLQLRIERAVARARAAATKTAAAKAPTAPAASPVDPAAVLPLLRSRDYVTITELLAALGLPGHLANARAVGRVLRELGAVERRRRAGRSVIKTWSLPLPTVDDIL